MDADAYQAIALALGLGLLVGLQRQWKESEIAGIRTFPLIAMLGAIAVLVGGESSHWVAAAGLLGLAALLVMANVNRLGGEEHPGMTTEVAALLMYGVGAALAEGLTGPAVVTTGVVAVLLHWKRRLHSLVERFGEKEWKALINMVLIALVILPLLPDRTYGPYGVLNPYKIWLMVALIVGISLAAYAASRLLGAKVGAVLGGVLGGLISSTATTVSYARRAKRDPSGVAVAALVIVIASAIANARVLFEIGVVAPQLLRYAAPPIAILLLLMAAQCGLLFIPLRNHRVEQPEHENPAQVKAAIVFGTLYAVILLAVAAAKHHFGNRALYGVAAVSGLTDVDAITLSTAELFRDGTVEPGTAWRVVVIALASNLVFKAAAAGFLGGRRLFLYVGAMFGLAIAASGALLWFWPDYQIPIPAAVADGPDRSDTSDRSEG